MSVAAQTLSGDAADGGANRYAGALDLSFSYDTVSERTEARGADGALVELGLESGNGAAWSMTFSNRFDGGNRPVEPGDQAAARSFVDLGLSIPAEGYRPQLDVEFSVGGFEGFTGAGAQEDSRHRFKMSSRGSLGAFDHGLSYQSMGTDFETFDRRDRVRNRDRGRDQFRSWIGKGFGNLYLKQFVETSEREPARAGQPVVADSLLGAEAGVVLSNWPYVYASVAQAAGSRDVRSAAGGSANARLDISEFRSSLNVAHTGWSANLFLSSLEPAANASGAYSGQPAVDTVYLGGSLYPDKTLTVTPFVTVTNEHYGDYAAETETVSTALSVFYRPAAGDYSFTAFASSDTVTNADWYMDSRYVFSQAGFNWHMAEIGALRRTLSLMLGYERYEDSFNTAATAGDVWVQLQFRLFGLGDLFGTRSLEAAMASPFSRAGVNSGVVPVGAVGSAAHF